jgi:hypothetical protein
MNELFMVNPNGWNESIPDSFYNVKTGSGRSPFDDDDFGDEDDDDDYDYEPDLDAPDAEEISERMSDYQRLK